MSIFEELCTCGVTYGAHTDDTCEASRFAADIVTRAEYKVFKEIAEGVDHDHPR